MEDTTILAIIFTIVLFAVIGFFKYRKAKKDNDTAEAANKLFTRDYNDCMTLNVRSPQIKSFVKIVPVKEISVAHESEKLHYGSVTTGSATVGGTYTTGGYDYVKDVKKTGKYKLETWRGGSIDTIQLNHDMYLQAKKSNIAEYLNDKEQIVVVPPADLSDVLIYKTQGRFSTERYPDYEKCKKILDWISGT